MMPRPRSLSRSLLPCSLGLAAALAFAGCARSVYRRAADREVYRSIDHKAERLGASSENWRLERGEDSRLFDPTNPDHPPMPEDDPVAHELMKTGPKSAAARGIMFEEGWRRSLPNAGDGEVVLTLKDAVRVAAANSRDFQRAREDLYLSALDLSEERYLFRPHLALGSAGSREDFGTTADRGKKSLRSGSVESTGAINYMTGWGTELLARAANTILFDFDNAKVRTATSLFTFSIMQPLMRFGGRARVLEPLTQAERHLLANVRRMEQYQQGFYLDIVAGRDPTDGPARASSAVSSAPALLAGSPSGVGGVPSASGFLGLLEEQQRIRNLETNKAGLQASLAQLQAAFDAGRSTGYLQVLQARQAVGNAQSSLLTSRAGYATRVDAFKQKLGLPPSLAVALRDPAIEQLAIFDPATNKLQDEINQLAMPLHDAEALTEPVVLREKIGALEKLKPVFAQRFTAARREVVAFHQALPGREAQYRKLRGRADAAALGLDPERFNPKVLRPRAVQAQNRIDALEKNVAASFDTLRELSATLPALEFQEARARASEAAASLSAYVLELSLDHAGARLESLTLPASDLDEARALAIARQNRLDWMNARAELVNAWRQIDYNANPLMSGLDLKLDGDLGSTGRFGSHLDTRRGHTVAGITIDTPLDRLRERNTYRESQISYQRARRNYQLFEDNVSGSLRNTLRLVELGQLNFELRRSAVQNALSQVDMARLKLVEPPKPGQVSEISVTTARDLVSAFADLLSAQNDFLSLYVGNEVLRMELDYELGLMEIDPAGHWVDPGAFTNEQIARRLERRPAAGEKLAANSQPAAASASAPLVQ
jgi:hypothetical protein